MGQCIKKIDSYIVGMWDRWLKRACLIAQTGILIAGGIIAYNRFARIESEEFKPSIQCETTSSVTEIPGQNRYIITVGCVVNNVGKVNFTIDNATISMWLLNIKHQDDVFTETNFKEIYSEMKPYKTIPLPRLLGSYGIQSKWHDTYTFTLKKGEYNFIVLKAEPHSESGFTRAPEHASYIILK